MNELIGTLSVISIEVKDQTPTQKVVLSVNGVYPDAYGNVSIEVGSGGMGGLNWSTYGNAIIRDINMPTYGLDEVIDDLSQYALGRGLLDAIILQ